MNKQIQTEAEIAQELALVASRLQEQRTGHAPKSVAVVLGDDTLVVTLHGALSPAEEAMARSPEGAAQVQDFHRRLFADSTDEMRREIKRITGREVRETTAEVETATGTVVHAFTTGAMVQVFLLAPGLNEDVIPKNGSTDQVERALDDGLRIDPEPMQPN